MTILVDVNVLLRIVLAEHPDQSPRSLEYVARAPASGPDSLVVSPVALSEFVWVLRGRRLGFTRSEIADALRAVLEMELTFLDKPVMNRAAQLYADIHPEWEDCVLAAYAMEQASGRVLSFDRGLSRFNGLSRIEP